MVRCVLHAVVGVVWSLLSSFVGQRPAEATFPDIMGCEATCRVATSGWPFAFVRDYPGMSVVGRADVSEVWFAADRFDWAPFLADVGAWGLASLAVAALMARCVNRRT